MKLFKFVGAILIALSAQLAFSSEVQAQTHVGDYYCDECGSFPGMGQFNTPEINQFIRTIVNQYVIT